MITSLILQTFAHGHVLRLLGEFDPDHYRILGPVYGRI